jgi:hypothetical protein
MGETGRILGRRTGKMEESREDEIEAAKFNLDTWLMESNFQSRAAMEIAMHSDSGSPQENLTECMYKMKECELRIGRDPVRWGEFVDVWESHRRWWAVKVEKWQNYEGVNS